MEAEIRFEQVDGPRSRQCKKCKLSLDVAGETVGRAEINDLTMRLCGAWVRMGGIANVVVQSQHRGKGYASRLMREAVAYMEREGYAVSILFGIPDFYHRFDYVPVMAEYRVSVAVRDAERLSATMPVRPAQQEDYAGLLDLYTRVNAGRSGAVRRTQVFYEALNDDEWWGHPTRILVTGEAGHPTGYVLLDGDPASLSVMDVIVPAEHVATAGASLIAWLGQEALARRRERLRLPMPPDEPLVGLLRGIGCKVETTYPANHGGMGRIVDLGALAAAIEPAIADRLQALPAETRPGSVEFDCPDTRQAHLEFGSGSVLTIRPPQQQLLQLLMGYRGVDELWREHGGADAGDLATIRALFPAGYPHMWELDHF